MNRTKSHSCNRKVLNENPAQISENKGTKLQAHDIESQISANSCAAPNQRLNLVDLTIPRSSIPYDEIRGMDVYDGYLYVDGDFSNLKKYTLDGTLVDSTSYYTLYYVTIHDSIIYSVEQALEPDQIKRYDMRTRSFMTRLLSPARSSEGVKVDQGKLYYCDFDKGIIGAVPITDLKPVQ